MSGRKCRNCGSTDIEVDTARGDAVCTNCGSVLEDNIIVAEVQFEENAHGASTALGQFVSADSKGGARGYGASFHVGIGTESREITLRRARQGITQLCQQLRLNNHCIDTACNFFKMALTRQLTRGRTSAHVHAACVYITCRTEGTAHLLIDISDVLQICCYELGRIYLKLSQALCINIPSIDPCLYILRFANRLDFGAKTHEVSMTALRLVQRMKRDCIHSGRRPSGLCGAALLIAARMHNFNRVPADIVRIVKVHETTLRKRLMEFGDTPSSALTLDEFMTIDLEADQDPPAFKAARKKDKERLAKLQEEGNIEFSELQREIDVQLENDLRKSRKRTSLVRDMDDISVELSETKGFINQSTMGTIQELLNTSQDVDDSGLVMSMGLGPDIANMCMAPTIPLVDASMHDDAFVKSQPNIDATCNFDDIDDNEIDTYIMTPEESKYKDGLWTKINAAFLEGQKAKKEKLEKEKEEGKPEKKKRRTTKKKNIGPSNTAAEAIEKMLQEKKISNKINYDILKSLTGPTMEITKESQLEVTKAEPVSQSSQSSQGSQSSQNSQNYQNVRSSQNTASPSLSKASRKPNLQERKSKPVELSVVEQKASDAQEPTRTVDDQDLEEDYYDAEAETVPKTELTSLSAMLFNEGGENEYYDYEDY